MNDDSLQDPRLRTFEARLASRPPQVSPARRDELLYASAFAAGRAAAVRPLRRWKTAAAALGAMLLCVTFAHVREPSPMAREPIELPAAADRTAPRRPLPAEPATLAQKPAAADLDAWQVPAPDGESLSEQLAQLERIDPHQRSLTVGTLTRAILKP